MPNTYETIITQPVSEDIDGKEMVVTRINEVRVIATDENGNTGASWRRVPLDPPDTPGRPAWVDIKVMDGPGKRAAIEGFVPEDVLDEIKAAADADLLKKLNPVQYVDMS